MVKRMLTKFGLAMLRPVAVILCLFPQIMIMPYGIDNPVMLQELINFTMNPNERYVTARRSGYPKIGSKLIPRINFEQVPVTEIPRRFDTGIPVKTDIMYDIITKAYQDQGFTTTARGENGPILHNERVWYDKGAPEWGAGQTL